MRWPRQARRLLPRSRRNSAFGFVLLHSPIGGVGRFLCDRWFRTEFGRKERRKQVSRAAAIKRLSPSAREDVCDLAETLYQELMAGLDGSPEEVNGFIRQHGSVLVGELLPVLEALVEPAALRGELLRLRREVGETHLAGLRLASTRSCLAAKATAP